MNIAVLLHSGAGGSGVVATELGLSFAKRGSTVHFVADRLPFRLTELTPNVYYHQVDSMVYPLFDAPLTTLAEASKLAEVVEEVGIDIIHAHYAVPHATAAILARDMVRGCCPPVVVTTLHGTDVTLVGLDRAYLRTTQYAISRSDHVTAVSRYLAEYTRREMQIEREIQVIYNAVDLSRFKPEPSAELRHQYAHPEEKLLVHISNFRPVKQAEQVVRIFAGVARQLSARLLMIGDGPERHKAFELARELGVSGRVTFLGSFPRVEALLAVCDLFLLPSLQESFGLAALEAMASGVPVVASDVGGIPEVVEDGVSGLLAAPDDTATLVRHALRLLGDPELHRRFAQAARARAEAHFSEAVILPQYQQAYERALARRRSSSGR
jgi:N-acetyl-alpha-D-glucosaminyl L-malate synthase BshA